MNLLSSSILRAGVIASAALFSTIGFIAHAQSQPQRDIVKVNVPFNFESQARKFKAGTYIISTVNQHVAMLRGSSASGMAMVMQSTDREPAENGKVVFNKYGERYFITDVYVTGSLSHLHLVKSSGEREVERKLRESHNPVGTVAVLEWPR